MKTSTNFGLLSVLSLAFAGAAYTDGIQTLIGADERTREAHLTVRAWDACLPGDFNFSPSKLAMPEDKNCVAAMKQELKADEERWRNFSALILLMGSILSASVAVGARAQELRRDHQDGGPETGL